MFYVYLISATASQKMGKIHNWGVGHSCRFDLDPRERFSVVLNLKAMVNNWI